MAYMQAADSIIIRRASLAAVTPWVVVRRVLRILRTAVAFVFLGIFDSFPRLD